MLKKKKNSPNLTFEADLLLFGANKSLNREYLLSTLEKTFKTGTGRKRNSHKTEAYSCSAH